MQQWMKKRAPTVTRAALKLALSASNTAFESAAVVIITRVSCILRCAVELRSGGSHLLACAHWHHGTE
jgi:hypothetical protein